MGARGLILAAPPPPSGRDPIPDDDRRAERLALVRDTVEMVVQVKGRVRGRITIQVGVDEDAITAAALAEPNVQRFVGDNPVRKVIVVPGKLVNIVV